LFAITQGGIKNDYFVAHHYSPVWKTKFTDYFENVLCSLKNKNPSNLLGLVLVVNGFSLSHQLRPYPPQALGLVLAEEGWLTVRN
jgi:hypothetical protein